MVGASRDIDTRTGELLAAANATFLELDELRAGRLPERLGDRRRSFGRATLRLGLLAGGFALVGFVAAFLAEERGLAVGLLSLVIIGLGLAVQGALVAGDRAFAAVDTVVQKTETGSPPQRTLVLAGRALRVDGINLPVELWETAREGEPVRAYLTKRGGVLLALEAR